jgi:hypothetical protein
VTAEDELLLLSAATEARRAANAERATDLAARIDWSAFLNLASRNRVLPLIATRVATWTDVPAAFADASARTAAADRRRSTAADLVAARILGELSRRDVRAMPLKGPALARHLYGDVGLRTSRDLDVLVAPGDLTPAGEALAAMGYQDDGRTHWVDGRPLLHVRYVHQAGLPAVELHWRVHWYEQRFSEAMLTCARPGDDGVLRAQPADEFAALLLFYARDGFAGVRLLADVAQWWDRLGAELGPDALERTVAAHPDLRRPLVAAGEMAYRLAGVPTDAMRVSGRASRRALRLADVTLRGSDARLRAELQLADLLLAPKGGRWAAVRRSLILPAAVIRSRDPSGPDGPRARVARQTIEHAARVAARWSGALWATRGESSRAVLPKWTPGR